MHKPLVSILMPAYNAEKYIGMAIKGILNQTFTDFEFVIINDGSTDNTEQIIKSFTDKRILNKKQENQGVAKTLNNGLEICKGKYIRRHDADDLSTPNSLKEQVEFIENNLDVGLVSSRQVYMTENSKIAKKYGLPSDAFFEGEKYKYVTLEDFTYQSSSPIVHGTVLFNKELVQKLGNYRPEFLTSEDNDLWTRILEHKKIVILNSKSYYQRLHSGSAIIKYKSSLRFYREKVLDFATERQKTGTDPLMRDEKMPKPIIENINVAQNKDLRLAKKRKLFRNDILDYKYRIFVDAKDWKLIKQSIKTALKDGWKLKQTWKAILFPVLGEKFVKFGVKLKTILRKF